MREIITHNSIINLYVASRPSHLGSPIPISPLLSYQVPGLVIVTVGAFNKRNTYIRSSFDSRRIYQLSEGGIMGAWALVGVAVQ